MAEDSESVGSQLSDIENAKHENSSSTYFVSYNNERSDDITKSLNAIVLQYLDSCGLSNASRAFIDDCKDCGLVIPEAAQYRANVDADFSVRDAEILLNAFDQDDGELILQLWKRLISSFNLPSGSEFTKVSFNVRLYVSLIPFYHDFPDGEKAESMTGLRLFFEETTNSNVADEEMLSLFALPYVNDPKSHAVFKKLFEPSWKDKLRDSMVDVIQTFYEQNKLTSQSRTDLAQMFINCSGLLDEAKHFNEEKRCDLCACKIPRNATATLNFTSGVAISNRSFSDGKSPFLSTNRLLQKIHSLTDENRELLSELRKDGERYLQLMKVSNRLVKSLELAVLGKSLDLLQLKQDIETAIPGIFTGIPLTGPQYSQESICTALRSQGSDVNYSPNPSAVAYVNYDENVNNTNNNRDINVNVQLVFEDCEDEETPQDFYDERNANLPTKIYPKDPNLLWNETENQKFSNEYKEVPSINAKTSSIKSTSQKSKFESVRSRKCVSEYILSENSMAESELSTDTGKKTPRNTKNRVANVTVENVPRKSSKKDFKQNKTFYNDSQTEIELTPRLTEQRKYRRTIPDPTVSSGRSEKDAVTSEGSRTYRMGESDKDYSAKKEKREKERPIVSIIPNETTVIEIKEKIVKAMGSKPIVRKKWSDSTKTDEVILPKDKDINNKATENLARKSTSKVIKGNKLNLTKPDHHQKTSTKPSEQTPDKPNAEKRSTNTKHITSVLEEPSQRPNTLKKKVVTKSKDGAEKNVEQKANSGRASTAEASRKSSPTPKLIPPSTKPFQWISASNYDIPLPAQSFQTKEETGGFMSRPKLPRSP